MLTYTIHRHGKVWQLRRVNFDGTTTYIHEARKLSTVRTTGRLLAGWRGRVTVIRSRG
jgi:hypothetical protein